MSLVATPVPTAQPRSVPPVLFWAGCTIAVCTILLAVLAMPGESNDRRALYAINRAFATLPFASSQATFVVSDVLETSLAAGLVVLWWAGRVGGFDANRLRRRALLAVAAVLVTYAVCALLGGPFPHPPPLLSVPLERFTGPETWSALDAVARTLGTFPSAGAALAAVIAVIAFSIDRRFGWAYLVFGLCASIADVGLGERWPSDAVGGLLVGTAVGATALVVAPKLRPFFDWILAAFARKPAVAYALAFVFLAEFGHGFARLEALARVVLHGAASD